MIIREIKKELIEKEPYQVWNEFTDLIATEAYEDLNDIQRKAHLIFWYDSEVNNGGHLQYFENQGVNHLSETINALRDLSAFPQAEILEKARNQFSIKKREKIMSVESYVDEALEGEYEDFDNEYYEVTPSITELLEKYLEKHKEDFVKII